MLRVVVFFYLLHVWGTMDDAAKGYWGLPFWRGIFGRDRGSFLWNAALVCLMSPIWKERGTITSLMFIVELKSFFVRSLCEWILAFDRIPTLSLVDLIDLLNFKVQWPSVHPLFLLILLIDVYWTKTSKLKSILYLSFQKYFNSQKRYNVVCQQSGTKVFVKFGKYGAYGNRKDIYFYIIFFSFSFLVLTIVDETLVS